MERLEENPHHYNPNSAGISAWDAKKSKERDAGLTGLEVECETIIAQVHATKELEQLQRELEAHKAAKTDYEAIGRTGKALREATAAVDSQLRAEKDWGTLRDRHVALVERLEVKCAALTEAENYDLLLRLGAKLNELKALDVSDLPQSRSNVSGLLPAPLAAPASAPAAVPHAQNADRA